MQRSARPAGQNAPALDQSTFWDDAFALAQEMRCGSDEVVAERWDRMVQQYPPAWMQWLSSQVGGLTEQGVVRRMYAGRELELARRLAAQVPPEALRAIATYLARHIPALDHLELSAANVADELEVVLTRELVATRASLLHRQAGAPDLLGRLVQSVADRYGAAGVAAPAVRLLLRAAGDSNNCAGLVIRRSDGQVLLVRRSQDDTRPGQWEFPGGHLKEGEPTVRGAAREAREELGRLPKRLKHETSIESPIPDGTYTNVFVQTDDDDFEPELNHEHDDWGWFDADTLPEDVNPGCLKALEDGPWDFGSDPDAAEPDEAITEHEYR